MSLIGIDIGSSSVKIVAYSLRGKALASASHPVTPHYPAPGQWETDPDDIWEAVEKGMCELGAHPALRRDPPAALAISASGRENFPADAQGKPLGRGLMGADVRGSEFEARPAGESGSEPWWLTCGHARERMDPVFRYLWWQKNRPEVMAKAAYFFGWIDYVVFRLTGQGLMDHSTASRYLAFDLRRQDWDAHLLEEFAFPRSLLPAIAPWGTVAGPIRPELARAWGLPENLQVAQGCHDLNCAAFGAGVSRVGEVCLVSGSYENILVPTTQMPTAEMLLKGLSVMPQPCEAGLSVIAVHPTGNAVVNWTRRTLGIPLSRQEGLLNSLPEDPSPVLASPYFSGAMTFWEGGRNLRGGFLGLTLATTPPDILKAMLESIVFDTVNTLGLMRAEGIAVEKIRITGGGARSAWWTQLKADLTGLPVETVRHPEPGTLGAAILAGYAIGIFHDLEETSLRLAGTGKVYEPQAARRERYAEKLEQYRNLITTLVRNVYPGGKDRT